MTALLLRLLLAAVCEPLPPVPALLFPPSISQAAPGVHLWVTVSLTEERALALESDGAPVTSSVRRYPERTRAVLELSPQGRLRTGAPLVLKLGDEVLATGLVGSPRAMEPWRGVGMVRWAKRFEADECVNPGPFIVASPSGQYLYLVSEGPSCVGPEYPLVLTRDIVPDDLLSSYIDQPSLIIGDDRRGAEPGLVFDPKARGLGTVCVRAADEEGNRSPVVRLTFDRGKPQSYGCVVYLNVKVKPRPLPAYQPGAAPSPEGPVTSRTGPADRGHDGGAPAR